MLTRPGRLKMRKLWKTSLERHFYLLWLTSVKALIWILDDGIIRYCSRNVSCRKNNVKNIYPYRKSTLCMKWGILAYIIEAVNKELLVSVSYCSSPRWSFLLPYFRLCQSVRWIQMESSFEPYVHRKKLKLRGTKTSPATLSRHPLVKWTTHVPAVGLETQGSDTREISW